MSAARTPSRPTEGDGAPTGEQKTWVATAAVLFLLSGFAALVYQVIWHRILGIFSGVHTYSITIIVTAFMAGLGFGSFFVGRLADRLSHRSAILAFAGAELLIGLFGWISPSLYYDLAYLKLGFLVRYPVALPLVHLALLFVPTFLMGASLPLLARGLVSRVGQAARTIGLLYGLNTVGAALGAFTATWYLIGRFGFVGAIHLAVALNLLAALGGMWIWWRLPADGEDAATETARSDEAAPPPPPASPSTLGLGSWALLYGLSGFIALSFEVLWFRIFDVFTKSSPFSFGHVLGVFLLFLSVGSLLGALLVHRARRPERVFFLGQWGIVLSGACGLLLLQYYPQSWWPGESLLAFWKSGEGIPLHQWFDARRMGSSQADSILQGLAGLYLGLPLLLLALPTFLMGFTYPYIQRVVQTDLHAVGSRVGSIQAANIVGAMSGSFVTGMLLLDWLGTSAVFRILIATGGVFGVLAVLRGNRRPLALVGAAGSTLFLALAIPASTPFWARFHGTPTEDVIVSEDASSVVVLERRGPRRALVRANGTGQSYLPFGGNQALLGLMSVLVHPEAKRVLMIGLGSGNTAWAAASAPTLEELTVYEIAKPEYDVISQLSDRWFDYPALDQLLADDRVEFSFSDGRLALRLEPDLYDVIEADALHAYRAYSGNLFSREFFELCRSRLAPGGIVLSHTPTSRARHSFAAAFPHVLHVGFFTIGSETPLELDRQGLLDRFRSAPFQEYFDRSGMAQQIESELITLLSTVEVVEVSSGVVTARDDTMVNTDLFPRDEYDKRARDEY